MQWKFIRTIGDPIDPRRNHAAALAGKYMIVHGGISPKDQYLNDFWVFDIGFKFSISLLSFLSRIKMVNGTS